MTEYIPDDWQKLLAFIEFEVGTTFDHDATNLGMIAQHLGCTRSEALALLKLLKRRGVLTTNKRYLRRRQWIVVKAA